jgi:branched-chain amino acid transport system substrate-binding protein
MKAFPPIAGFVAAASFCLAGAWPMPAIAQDTAKIGIAAPLSGYFEILGEQTVAGVEAALRTRQALTHQVEDDGCDTEGGARSARNLVIAGTKVVIGFPCIEAFDGAIPILAQAGIPVIAVGIRAEGITDETSDESWPVLRLAPRNADEAEAIAGYLREAWRTVNYAIIDDGTLYGRQLAETVRFLLEEDNLKPVFTDNYRPQLENQMGLVRRLQRAGATHVFIGGDAFDAAVIAGNAETIDVPLTIAGGSALVAPPSAGKLAEGTIVARLADWSSRDAASEALPLFEGSALGTDGYVLPAYAAAEIAIFGLDIAGDDGAFPYQRMLDRTFDTVIGPLRFDRNGELVQNLFEVAIVRDGELVPVVNGRSEGAGQ